MSKRRYPRPEKDADPDIPLLQQAKAEYEAQLDAEREALQKQLDEIQPEFKSSWNELQNLNASLLVVSYGRKQRAEVVEEMAAKRCSAAASLGRMLPKELGAAPGCVDLGSQAT
jgi:predicted transcriptional regulator